MSDSCFSGCAISPSTAGKLNGLPRRLPRLAVALGDFQLSNSIVTIGRGPEQSNSLSQIRERTRIKPSNNIQRTTHVVKIPREKTVDVEGYCSITKAKEQAQEHINKP